MADFMDISRPKTQRRPLSGDLLFELRQGILQGKYREGDKLTEQYICDEYQVSRTPVREAIRQLEAEGLIETIPNRGAFVTGVSPQDLLDLYEMRKSFEILAVRWAVERATPRDLEELEEAFEFMAFYTQKMDPRKMLNINMQFHNKIYQASRNKRLQNILASFQVYIKLTKANTAYLDGCLEEVLEEHRQIYQAFLDKDPEAGAKACAIHLDNAKARAAENSRQ